MNPGPISDSRLGSRDTTETPGRVSGRFLTDLFGALEQRGVPAIRLIGDLPIPVDSGGRVARAIEWSHFSDFMRRLEREVDGAEGLERCGETLCQMQPAAMLRGLAGITASPYALYRAASRWALRRALPGIDTTIERQGATRLEIRARVAEGLRACPQIFHLAVGGARTLPRILGMPDAVVAAEIGDREAVFQITLPPSRTLIARLRRLSRTIFSSGSMLHFLEAQQLELHAKHDALERARAELAETQRRYRAISEAAIDVLCEIDERGHVAYVGRGIHELLGYSPEQVVGSHFRLWVPKPLHERVGARFEAARSAPDLDLAPAQHGRLTLHAAHARRIVADVTARPCRTATGDWRLVLTLRESTHEELPADSPNHGRMGSHHTQVIAAHARPLDAPLEDPLAPVVATGFFETRKIIERARSTSGARREGPLRVDLSRAPAQLFGQEDLLVACFAGLLDWAHACARGQDAAESTATDSATAGVSLRLSHEHSAGGPPTVRITVSIEARSLETEEATACATARRALETAFEATRALGGEVASASDTTGTDGLSQSIRLRLSEIA